MMLRVAWFAIVLLTAGCTREWDPGRVTAQGDIVDSLSMPTAASGPHGRLRGRMNFASLPDRGQLLAYPDAQAPRRDGAYIWHRAELSEAYALRAIAERKLRITTPSGQMLSFEYTRHVEHPSGDWTWIGRLEGGDPSDEIIVTFGERAAFGSIAQPGKESLRLTVNNGVSWLVETDGTAISAIDNAATRPRGPDYRIPPKIGKSGMAASVSAGESQYTLSTAATAASGTVVDVVLGYSNGFAAGLGGQSQALTRLNYLIDVTNQAYVNSQVNAQIRLVHAIQVDYPDTTTNDMALEQLTGFRAPSTPTSPSPAFAALRTARDQYGADLVSLVRKFYDPEQDGCGIAWLIGGGQSGIDASDEFFGYSVVSDGTDIGNDGKSYFCRDETLAHELGHNMGSQHDRATATVDGELKYGVFSYSFGYKTGAGNGNFYTIMAYGDTGQTRYRVFANPRTAYCGGIACGIADVADNARSLALTMPVVSGFRATVVTTPPPDTAASPPLLRQIDVNGNGTHDIFAQNNARTQIAVWYMFGNTRVATSLTTLPGAYQVIDTGDMSGDRRGDILYSDSNRNLYQSTSNGGGFGTGKLAYSYPLGWLPVGLADVNGNGTSDLILHHEASGASAVWFFVGATRTAYFGFNVPVGYRFIGSGDIDGDRRADLVWTNAAGQLLVSISQGNRFVNTILPYTYGGGYVLLGLSDASGDGRADLVFWHQTRRELVVWIMAGTTRVAYFRSVVPSGYRIIGRGDFDGDGRGDMLWTDTANRVMYAYSKGSSYSYSVLPYLGASGWYLMAAMP